MERKTRFELATLALARRCSTPEPLPHEDVNYNIMKPRLCARGFFRVFERKIKTRACEEGGFFVPSDVLLSRDPAVQVPSALKSLTSVFEMGTGVTSSPLSLDSWCGQEDLNLHRVAPTRT